MGADKEQIFGWMKVCCVQFEPSFKDRKESQQRADFLMQSLKPGDVDFILLPELAFTGYVFESVDDVQDMLEDAETGPTVTWAKELAQRLKALVAVGYPQIQEGKLFNSMCIVSRSGQLLATYQKHFLYETDEHWAQEGPSFLSIDVDGLQRLGFGICMDLNPYQYKADFSEFEFGNFHKQAGSQIIFVAMAWKDRPAYLKEKDDDGTYLINYWVTRLTPMLNTPTKLVICNRIGTEKGTTFGGCSCVVDLSDLTILGNLDEHSSELLIVDTAIQ